MGVHKGFSIKLVCGDDDTIRVNHWFDVTGKAQPCAGKMLSEEPLIKELPWELAVRFIKGECTWSSEHGAYGKLNVALPSGGYPTCDFTGASIRRLTSQGNNTNASAPGPSPPAQTPPANSNPTPAATPAASGANTGTTGSNSSTATNSSANTTADPAASPTPAPPGVASGSLGVSAEPALIAAFCAVTLTTIVV